MTHAENNPLLSPVLPARSGDSDWHEYFSNWRTENYLWTDTVPTDFPLINFLNKSGVLQLHAEETASLLQDSDKKVPVLQDPTFELAFRIKYFLNIQITNGNCFHSLSCSLLAPVRLLSGTKSADPVSCSPTVCFHHNIVFLKIGR